jgi:hypothetical protein
MEYAIVILVMRKNIDFGDLDPLLPEIIKFIVNYEEIGTSPLQRKYLLGYTRTIRIMNQLFALGIVEKGRGVKPRKVLKKLKNVQSILDEIEDNHKNEIIESEEILKIYDHYVGEFCEIAKEAEGETFDQLKKECIIRIAKDIYREEYLKSTAATSRWFEFWFDYLYENKKGVEISDKAPLWAKKLFNEILPERYKLRTSN